MDPRSSILIVDDHKDIRDPLSTYIRRFEEAVADGKAMRQRLEARRYSLIILDIMLSGEDGLSLCRYVSEHVGTPVILLTAMTEQADRIAGLEIGAAVYVVKPFDPRELVAPIRSVLRRNRVPETREPSDGPAPREYRFTFCGWTFDTRTRALRNPRDEEVPGIDIVKAIASGATAVLLGQPVLHALAVGGMPGVAHMLTLLQTELEIAMALTGCPTLDAIDASVLARSR